MQNYIPELSEIRMVRRAPDRPPRLTPDDAAYIEACLRGAESAFGIEAAPGAAFSAIKARTLVKFFIDCWRGLTPQNADQNEAYGRLPSAIRLLDNYSAMEEERGRRD
jgi:hypothetical protein